MRKSLCFLGLALAVLAGCESGPPFNPVSTTQELMQSIVDPAADGVWLAVGTIVSEEETVEIFPRTQEDWASVVNASRLLIESGNLLMMEGRARDPDTWMKMAGDMSAVGEELLAAGLEQNPDKVFDLGSNLYYTCDACHMRYWVGDLQRGRFDYSK